MNHRPSVLWDKNLDKVQSTVRAPSTLSTSNYPAAQESTQSNSLQRKNHNAAQIDSVKQNNDRELLIANSNLNVDAEEFVPFQTQNVYIHNQIESLTSSVQNRLKIHKTEPSKARETVDHSGDFSNSYSSDLNRLKQIISTLTKDPGQFHNLIELFMETLEPYLEDVLELSPIAEIIVEQAINHPNFRYTGGRLCWFIEQTSPGFRAELHLRCKKQIDENPDTKNVLPFIAELYSQLPHLNIYGTLLISAFKKLIDIGGNDNVKCICQALKLTGYSLENSNRTDLDNLFSDLKSVRGKVDGTAKILLESVFQLRSATWGHSAEEATELEHENEVPFDGEEDNVLYDMDGEGLTHEESEFIATHMTANDDFESDDFDPDELCDPEPEMDEEIQEAFKEFVRLSGKH